MTTEVKLGRKPKDSRKYVNINDRYRFSSDRYTFILEEWKDAHLIEKGKYKGQMSQPKWKEIAYHGDLRQLIEFCIQWQIRDAKGDLIEIFKSLEESKEMLKTLCPKIVISNGQCVLRDE